MKNQKQLLNKENWLKYLQLADEGGLTNNAKANDIVKMIEEAINYTRCCTELPNDRSKIEKLVSHLENKFKE